MVADGKRVEPEAVHLVGQLDARPEPALADRCLGTVGPRALVARRDADGRRAGPEHATDDAEDAVRRDLDLVGRGPPRPLGDDEATVAVGLEHEAAAGRRDPRPGLGEDVHPLAVAGPRRQVPDARDAGRRGWQPAGARRGTPRSGRRSPRRSLRLRRRPCRCGRRPRGPGVRTGRGRRGLTWEAVALPRSTRSLSVWWRCQSAMRRPPRPSGAAGTAPAAPLRMSRVTGCSTVKPGGRDLQPHAPHTGVLGLVEVGQRQLGREPARASSRTTGLRAVGRTSASAGRWTGTTGPLRWPRCAGCTVTSASCFARSTLRR